MRAPVRRRRMQKSTSLNAVGRSASNPPICSKTARRTIMQAAVTQE
jgi:hypothetical protein